MRTICLLLLAVILAAAHAAFAAPGASTTTFYGHLKLPAAYFAVPDDAINHVQPGAVALANQHTTIRVPVQRDGSFVVYHLPYDTYLLQADYHDFTFPTVRVDVQYREADGVRIPVIRSVSNDYPVKPLDGTGTEEGNPAIIPTNGVHKYFIPREQFSVVDFLKNPMIALMLVSFALLGMMKLFPEEEVRESQKMTRNWQRKMMSAAMGTKGDSEAAAPPAVKQ